MERVLDTILRTFVGFALTLVLTRLAGKKQLGQATFFTYITGIAFGNMVGDMIIHKDVEIIDGIVGMSLWALIAFVMELMTLNMPRIRGIMDGEPTFVIKKGVIQEKVLRKMRLNMENLSAMLRERDVFSIQDVYHAIVEPHGELSIVKKIAKQQSTKEDLGMNPAEKAFVPCRIIVDGHIIENNLTEYGKTLDWLNTQLKIQDVASAKQVLYAELGADGTLFVQRKGL